MRGAVLLLNLDGLSLGRLDLEGLNKDLDLDKLDRLKRGRCHIAQQSQQNHSGKQAEPRHHV